jgi:hypothetical protein
MYTSMRKLSLLSILCLCLWSATASAQLTHYWSFDNPTPLWDEGLGGGTYGPHDARLVDYYASYQVPTLVTGKFGNAYDLGTAGNGDILIGGDNATNSTVQDGTFPSPPCTISFWFYPVIEPTQGAFLYLVGNYFQSSNQDRFYVGLTKATTSPYQNGMCFSIGANKNQYVGATPTHPIAIGTWHHAMMIVTPAGSGTVNVTVVPDGDTTNAVTTNGCTQSGPGSWMFDRGNKRLGTNGNSREVNKTFTGIMDDCAIWNEALPATQATFMWNSGTGRRGNVGSGKVAYDPTPADKSQASNVAQLKWYNALRYSSSTCDVYLSSDRADLFLGTNNQPAYPAGKLVASGIVGAAGTQSTASVSLPTGSDTTYYWRVVSKPGGVSDANWVGPVWSFLNLANTVPVANAGNDIYTYAGKSSVTLSGTVTDDGRPSGATVTCTWKDSGGTPITTTVVQTGNSYACTATVSVGAVDTVATYTLEGNDTTGAGSDTMNVYVKSTPCLAAQSDPYYLRNTADIDNDCLVTFKDFALTVNKWKVCTALDANCN